VTEPDEVARLLEGLGAPRAQAERMAAQLVKRADQLAVERSRPREAELARLIEMVVQGRAGVVPPEFSPGPPSGPDTKIR
jgi:hypothetical protein